MTWFLRFSFDNNWVSQLDSQLSVKSETVENKTKIRTLSLRYGDYRRRRKIEDLLGTSHCSLQDIFENKLNLHSQKCLEPGQCWTADHARLHSQAGATLATEPGLRAALAALPTRTCPGDVAFEQPCWLPRTLRVKTLIGFLRNTGPNQRADAMFILWLL